MEFDQLKNEIINRSTNLGMGFCCLGDSGVGKTTAIERMIKGMGEEINPVSTTANDVNISNYKQNLIVPFEFYQQFEDESELVLISSRGDSLNLVINDLAGQYNDLSSLDMNTFMNAMPIKNARVLEFVADAGRPSTLGSLINNWLPFLKEGQAKENVVYSVYISKAAIDDSKINFEEIKEGNYSSLEAYGPLNDLLSRLNGDSMVFVGDMNIRSENGYTAELYLIKSQDWLETPYKVDPNASKMLPSIRYAINERRRYEKALSDGNEDLMKLYKPRALSDGSLEVIQDLEEMEFDGNKVLTYEN